MTDTVKRVDSSMKILETVPRDRLYLAQTPQVFQTELYKKALLKETVKKHKNILVAVVISLYLLVTLIFYEGIHSLFPIVANSSYLIAMVKKTKKGLLIGGIISPVLWLSYGIFVGSYASAITEFILLVSNIIQLIKIEKKNSHN